MSPARLILITTLLCCLLTAARADSETAPTTMVFDRALVEHFADANPLSALPISYDQAVIASSPAATRTVWIELQDAESADQVVVRGLSESIVENSVSLAPPMATSSNYRYEARIISAEQDTDLGRKLANVTQQVLGDRRFARLQLFPVYISRENTAVFVDSVSIEIDNRPILPADVLTRHDIRQIKEQGRQRARTFAAASDTPEYVIITNSELASAFRRLATYKTATGIPAAVKPVEDILTAYGGRDDAESIRNFLKDFYADGGYYVLLGGDETILPVRYAYHRATSKTPTAYDLQLCDLYFADLTGKWECDGDGVWGERRDDSADVTPELAVGRLPFNSAEQVKAYIDKLIAYETNPGNGDFSYLGRAFFYSADQLRDYADIGQHALVAEAYPDYFVIDTVTGVEALSGIDPTPVNAEPKASLDTLANGYGLVSILVHGRTDGFAIKTAEYNAWPKSYILTDAEGTAHGDLDSLPPNNKVGLYYTVACDMGGFDMDQPPFNHPNQNIVENALTVPGAGAVAFVAYSRWGWVSSSHLLQSVMMESLFANPDRPAIEAMYASQDRYYYYRDLVYGQNWYGDPTVRIYTDIPHPLQITTQYESAQLTARVLSDGQPVAGAQVVVADTSGPVVSVATDQTGTAVIDQALDAGRQYTLAARRDGFTKAVTLFTPSIVTDVDEDDELLPGRFNLSQNYPNPFNPATTIAFSLAKATEVRLAVYNVLGQHVDAIVNTKMSAGEHQVAWNGRDKFGREVPSGVYFYRLQAGDYRAVKKMTLIR